jgi:hypothetical protein
MQAAVSSAAHRHALASELAHGAWMRFKALLSGATTSSNKPTGTNDRMFKTNATHSRKDKMLLIAAEMLQRHHQLSMLVLAIRDLPELEGVFGHAAAKQALAIAAGKLTSLAGNARALRTAPTLLTLLLPGWESQHAADAVFAAFGNPCCIELEVDGQGVVVLPEIAAQTVSRETSSMDAVYDDLCRTVSPGHPRRRHHHSHKDCVLAARTEEATRPLANLEYPPMPPTIPIRLGAC